MLGVTNWYGSGIHFEFGNPHLEIHEPRTSSRKASRRVREALARRLVVHGDWHLCIDVCDWEIFQKRKRIGTSRSRSDLERIVRSLNGQKLIRFLFRARGNDCLFEFDLSSLLITHRFESGPDYVQWTLFDPTHNVLILRADNKYSHQRSDQPLDAGLWKPIFRRAKPRSLTIRIVSLA